MSNHLLDVCAIIDISQDGGWFQMIKNENNFEKKMLLCIDNVQNLGLNYY